MSLYRLKNPPPPPVFLGGQNHLRQKADQRLNNCQEQPLSSFSQFFSPALPHFFYICTWYPSSPFAQSPDLTSYFLLYVSPSSHAVCTTVSSISSVNPSLACRLRYFVFYRETGWVREKRRGKRLANVQLYIHQCSEPNTRSALGYVLNRKAKRKRQKGRNKREYVMVCLLAKRLQQMVRHAFISAARMV